jgi:hypothetical protein
MTESAESVELIGVILPCLAYIISGKPHTLTIGTIGTMGTMELLKAASLPWVGGE